jgi:hypothetical protein
MTDEMGNLGRAICDATRENPKLWWKPLNPGYLPTFKLQTSDFVQNQRSGGMQKALPPIRRTRDVLEHSGQGVDPTVSCERSKC